MAVGKNKKTLKKKSRKVIDPFVRKDWYDIKAPSVFNKPVLGKTVITKTTGQKIASEGLKGRIVEACLADLQNDEEQAFRKIKLKVEEVQDKRVLTQFYGMDLTTDKLRSLVRKWHSLIEATVDVTTTDGYKLRLFTIGFTKKRKNQTGKCYAQSAQIKQIRAKMVEIMKKESVSCDLKELVLKFIPELIGKEIEKACQGIFPLENVYMRKVKLLKAPKFDITKFMELHKDGNEDGTKAKDTIGEVEESTIEAKVEQREVVGI